jgi:hypothetical protein
MVPIESFTVVMATGIVAVPARDNHSTVADVLAVLAGAGLVVLVGWATVALAVTGRALGSGTSSMDRTCGLFGSWPRPTSLPRRSIRPRPAWSRRASSRRSGRRPWRPGSSS